DAQHRGDHVRLAAVLAAVLRDEPRPPLRRGDAAFGAGRDGAVAGVELPDRVRLLVPAQAARLRRGAGTRPGDAALLRVHVQPGRDPETGAAGAVLPRVVPAVVGRLRRRDAGHRVPPTGDDGVLGG